MCEDCMRKEKKMRTKDLVGYDGNLPFRLDAEDVIDIIERNNMDMMEVRDIIQIAIFRELRAIRVKLEDE